MLDSTEYAGISGVAPAAPRRRVLVVEHDADLRTLLSLVLVEERYDVESATDSAEALTALQRRRPDLVVLDAPPPGTSSRAFHDERRRGGWGDIPLLVLTSDDRAASEAMPPAMVLPKPFDLDALLRSVHQLADASPGAVLETCK